jgi:hypothetical protein
VNINETNAQRQLNTINAQTQAATQEATACLNPVLQSPLVARLKNRFILNPDDPGRVQRLADRGYMTKNEADDFVEFSDARRPCQQLFVEKLGAVHPVLVSPIAEMYAEADADLAAAINKEITVGEFNKRTLERIARFKGEFHRAQSEAISSLSQSHNAEIQQRQAASQSLQNWLYQQQVLLNQQQAINSMNRPRITNCQYFGNQIRCTGF